MLCFVVFFEHTWTSKIQCKPSVSASTKIMNVFFALLSFWSSVAALELCDVCLCKHDVYYNEMKNMVNCTFRELNISSISLLENLPNEAEVLILSNNHLPVLPVNLFGSEKNKTSLQVIDMSNNKIEHVKGKTFHHVPNVELLIMDHNSISFDSHPRMFSNLENLKELHLTDAFRSNQRPNFASHLQEVFTNSSMNKLEKLHLEQNEISDFSDANVFCSLENLLDLHLANNNLTKVHFRIDCLPRLRFLDLEANFIRTFTKKQLAEFDALPARNQSLMIDVSRNPFVCDCKTNLYAWMRTTKVVVRGNASLQCQLGPEKRKIFLKQFDESFCAQTSSPFDETSHSTHIFANVVLLAVLCGLIVLLFYISARYSMDYFRHSGASGGKVHYVVIQNFDENREVRV